MVAATFDRTRFWCGGCCNGSGDPSCDGARQPDRVWPLFGNKFPWRGCPRSTLKDSRITAWLNLHERVGGRLDYASAVRAPHLLHVIFSAIDHADRLLQREQAENADAERRRL